MFTTNGINTGISDLWFNHDKTGAENPRGKGGEFAGYDEAALKEHASDFRDLLSFAGIVVTELPSPEQLIEDFYSRL